jgi:C-terminal processing protease CtpA/Prc
MTEIDHGLVLAEVLTAQLQSIGRDRHLVVRHSGPPLAPEPEREVLSPEERERRRARLQEVNFGFEKLERLAGNVGYLDLRAFAPSDSGAETAVAAMNFLAGTDALIIDLRQNSGGDPSMVALISSYLFEPEPVHLNDLQWRDGDRLQQWWTLPHVPGRRSSTKDVWVLTSRLTFSAAEEFAYNLKSLGRATVVGETTGGGAHPSRPYRLDDHFELVVPVARAVNPVTGRNWEATGVEPDLAVPAPEALEAAHLAALRKLAAGGRPSGEVAATLAALERKRQP